MTTILIVLLVLLLCGGLTPPALNQWGPYPSGAVGVLLLVLLVLLLTGRL